MPNKVDAFIKQRITDAVIKYLKEIRVANGYNTTPAVFDGPHNPDRGACRFLLEVDDGPEDRVHEALDQKKLWEAEVLVTGWIRPENLNPRTARNMLIQDVRTAILSNSKPIGVLIGRGQAISLGRCETDQGVFLDEGFTGFEQTFLFRYYQGATS